MKKTVALILVLVLSCLMLFSCSGYYRPVANTEEEDTTVIKLSFGNEVYEVKYELYRFFFLNFKKEVDGGDDSVWLSAEKDSYIEKINNLIFARICDIYAIFSLAKEIGINVYSDAYDEAVLETVKVSVDGGVVSGTEYTGFDGDYNAYLDSLKEKNLNYSVQDLMIRYLIATNDIFYYFNGNVNNDANPGALAYTKQDVLAFYNSDECVRVYQLYLSKSTTSFTKESASILRDEISRQTSEGDVIFTMIGNAPVGDNIKDSTVIGKYNLGSLYYEELTRAAFELKINETSPVIEIKTPKDEGFYILYRTNKTNEHFEKCYDEIAGIYVDNVIEKKIIDRTNALLSGLTKTEAYSSIIHANVSMD